MHSRRSFLGGLSGAFALPASWGACAQALAAAAKAPDATSEAYWSVVRRQFPLEEGLVYLNAANLCPASRPVLDRHQEFLRDMQANPSFQNRDKYRPRYESLRAKLGRLLGAEADEIAITRNTSEGSNIIVHGVDLKAGDEVIITEHNHPSNNESWKIRARRDGFVVNTLPVPVPAGSAAELIDGVRKAITPRTRVIAITHVTSTTGILYPAKEIAELARARGIWMHLDGAQSFGALAVNLQEIGCDSYSGSSHKWAMGPLESGVLYVRKERLTQVWPSIVTAGWSDKLVGARKLENMGQRDDPRVVAFEAAVDFLDLLGMKNVEARMRALATHAKERFAENPRLKLKTNMQPELSGGVVKVFPQRRAIGEVYDALWAKHRVAIARTDSGDSAGLRFSPQIYNSFEEIDRVAAALQDLA